MKKTKDSWFFFALYSMIYLMLAVCAGGFLARKLQITQPWQATVLTVGMLVCACFLFGMLRTLGVRLAVRRGRKSYVRKIPSFFCTEILPIVLLYAITLAIRVWIAYQFPLELNGDESLFADAGVLGSYYGDLRSNPLGILLVYRWLLRGAFLIFGNTTLAVFLLNTVIQLFVVLFGYLVLRAWGNRKAAIAYAVLWNVLPCSYAMLLEADASVLYILLWTIALLFMVCMCRPAKDGSILRCVGCTLCGIISGYLLIGHVSYVLVFVGVIALLMQYSNAKKQHLLCYSIGGLVGVLAVIITGAVCYASKWDIASLMQGAKDYITAYVDIYLAQVEFMPLIDDQCVFPYTLLVVWMLAGGLLFLFYKNERESLRLFASVYLAGAAVYLLGLDKLMNGEAVLTGIGILMMAVGFGMIMTMKSPLAKGQAAEVIEPEIPNIEDAIKPEETDKSEEAVKPEETDKSEEAAEPQAESVVIRPEESAVEEVPKPEETPVAPVQFIENPLPLPKKHVRKEMDYQYEVSQDKMNYDVIVGDNDDFDIQ